MQARTIPNARKSSYSGNGGMNCVEVGSDPRGVLLADTKDPERAVILRTSPANWRRFLADIRSGAVS